jgi:tRNA-dihydrouridine synthase B
MADAARINVESGAQIIEINMGCPAKKVNRKLAGSALLQYPDQVKSILTAVVSAVDVPVTLKIRTGWSPEHRNCVEIAQLAEDCGIQALTIHGRTRACLFNGDAEYDSIRAVKQKVSIPVIANGDITDPLKARAVPLSRLLNISPLHFLYCLRHWVPLAYRMTPACKLRNG